VVLVLAMNEGLEGDAQSGGGLVDPHLHPQERTERQADGVFLAATVTA